MAIHRNTRVCERWFLNLPGFHGGAYVLAYLEDTAERGPGPHRWCDDDCLDCPHNFEPRVQLEIADCNDRVSFEFDFDSEGGRRNSLHKLETLIVALRVFRSGLEQEQAEFVRREQELKELNGE